MLSYHNISLVLTNKPIVTVEDVIAIANKFGDSYSNNFSFFF
jgi:hypothetical protein